VINEVHLDFTYKTIQKGLTRMKLQSLIAVTLIVITSPFVSLAANAGEKPCKRLDQSGKVMTQVVKGDSAMKIRSYVENDYNLYVAATGGTSSDEVHIRFNTERNAYLKANVKTTPAVQALSAEDEVKVETVNVKTEIAPVEKKVKPSIKRKIVVKAKANIRKVVTNKVTKKSGCLCK
jgi:hypothetical protein